VLHDVIPLPQSALQGPGEVWVVDSSGVLRARMVDVVRAEADGIWVQQGLDAGERVVAHISALLPGERVRTHDGPSGTRVASGPTVHD